MANAFLYALLDVKFYITLPSFFHDYGDEHVYGLLCSLYGLKQSHAHCRLPSSIG